MSNNQYKMSPTFPRPNMTELLERADAIFEENERLIKENAALKEENKQLKSKLEN